jgi:hypothetical protein
MFIAKFTRQAQTHVIRYCNERISLDMHGHWLHLAMFTGGHGGVLLEPRKGNVLVFCLIHCDSAESCYQSTSMLGRLHT